MIFKSVRIKEGFTERKFEFTDGANLRKIAAGKQHYFGLCYILSATISRIHEKSILNGARWEVKFSVMRWEM